MRTDVKLGVVISMVVVLAAGGYFLFRGEGEAPIPVAGGPANPNPSAAKPSPAKPPAAAPKRQVITNKDAVPKPSSPATSTAPRENRLANKPVDRPAAPAVSPPSPGAARPAQPQPRELAATAAPVSGPNLAGESKAEPKPSPPVSPALPAERVADATGSSPPLSGGAIPLSGTSPSNTTPPGVTAPVSGADLSAAKPPISAEKAASDPSPPIKPAAAPADARSAAVDTHKVQPGDSLATLAQAYYGGSKYAKFLADSNPQITDPARLSVGTIVKIPTLPADIESRLTTAAASPKSGKSPAATTTGGKRTYKVQPGDSFYRIAKDQLGNAARWKELYALNKNVVHGDPTQLQVGQTLVLPDS